MDNSDAFSPLSEPTKTRVVKTIVEEVVDGKVVSSQVKSVEERTAKWEAWKTGTFQMHGNEEEPK